MHCVSESFEINANNTEAAAAAAAATAAGFSLKPGRSVPAPCALSVAACGQAGLLLRRIVTRGYVMRVYYRWCVSACLWGVACNCIHHRPHTQPYIQCCYFARRLQ